MKTYLKNARVLTDGAVRKETGVLCEDGAILALCDAAPADAEVRDLGGATLAPAFCDLHCHGGAGYEFIDATEEAVLAACRVHAEHGTGILYPTISAAPYDVTYRALETLERCREKAPLYIPGVHLEGPYLAPEMCGAQDTDVIRKPDPKEYHALWERFGGLIARWDYAPERDEDGAFAAFLREKGIVAATAHSAAQYSHMKAALEAGNRLVTHLYSCTSTVVREGGFRKLGVIESAFLEREITVETIGDGRHLPPELLRMIWQIKGADRTCLITDAIRFAGSTVEGSVWSGKIPYLIEDGVAKLADRSAFAGSIATADVLLREAVAAGIPLADAVTMLTSTPARAMGRKNCGSIAPGFEARFTVIGDDLSLQTLSLS